MGYMYALSWKVLIIGPPSEYFETLLKILHLKKIARKCFIFLHQLYFFLMVRSRTSLFGIRIKFHLGRTKGRGKGGIERSPKYGFFCKIPIIKQDTNFISQIVHQTNF